MCVKLSSNINPLSKKFVRLANRINFDQNGQTRCELT